jgi:hypothetical protein
MRREETVQQCSPLTGMAGKGEPAYTFDMVLLKTQNQKTKLELQSSYFP